MDRIRRMAEELMQRHPEDFGLNFEENKKAVEKIAEVRSKMIRNKIAGYVTKIREREQAEAAEKAEAQQTVAAA